MIGQDGCGRRHDRRGCLLRSLTGLHGANRLGSNSLLEGLVYGKLAGRSAAAWVKAGHRAEHRRMVVEIPVSDRSRLDAEDVRNALRALMWRNVGITRQAQPLVEAQEIIRFWQRYVMDKVFTAPFGWECQNMLTVALQMAQSALQRQESRGVHYRQDFAERVDSTFGKHIEVSRERRSVLVLIKRTREFNEYQMSKPETNSKSQ